MLEIKTVEELHDMTKSEIVEYKNQLFQHWRDVDALVTYVERIGRPKLLAEPTTVEYEVEE